MSPPRVYIQVGVHPPRAADARIADWVQAAGGLPFRAAPGGSLDVSWEEVLEFDPQMVIYAVEGQGSRFDPEEFLRIEGWNRTEAAVSRRVYSVDETALREAVTGLLKEQFEGGSKLENHWIRRLSGIISE